MRLSINIDHVATLREQRKEGFPSPLFAALLAVQAGAHGITAHLREDRRHTSDDDIRELRKHLRRLNLEMAVSEDIIGIALEVIPDQVTFVPEKREELTTEGGLAVAGNVPKFKTITERFKEAGIDVSFFVEPSFEEISAASECGADIVELHTGTYATAFLKKNKNLIGFEIKRIIEAVEYAGEQGLRVHIGHGLSLENVKPFRGVDGIEEASIGHSIVCDAVLEGFQTAVYRMREELL